MLLRASGRKGGPAVLRIDGDGEEIRVHVPAEIDLATAKDLADSIRRACAMGPERVVLDLSKVTFCDLTALRVLVDAADRMRDEDCALELRSPSPTLQRLAQLLGLSGRLGMPADGGSTD